MKKFKSIVGTASAILMLVGGMQISALGQDDERLKGPQDELHFGRSSIVGAWRTVVTPQNCSTGVPAPVSIRGLFTFHKGGTMSEFGVGPGSSPALRSPGHGVWQREHGWRNYSFKFTFYLYDAAGAYTGRQNVAATLIYDADGDGFTTASSVEVRNATDTVVANFCATSVGTRFE